VRSAGTEDEATGGTATWTDPVWRAAAVAWAVERLERSGLRLAGDPEQPHVHPWSTALRLPVRGGAVWLKSVGPGSAHEPPLSAALGSWVPDHVLVPLAVDAERRLVLLPVIGREGGLDSGVRDRIAADLDHYAELCARLSDGGVPATLQHDDLHDGNVFVEGERHRFFDWGDASVSHPFVSLLVTLRVAGQALDLPNGDPVLHRVRDAYLGEWRDQGSPAHLREQCALALRIGPLQRALTWRRILRGVHSGERAEWADSVPGWTAEHLEPGTLTAAPVRG
jgi:hypothetical protein